MFANETELKDDVREMTGYTSTTVLPADGLDTAYRAAQRHIKVERTFEDDFDWFNSENVAEQDALFWFTCLFTKVQTGELDSQDLQIGAVDAQALLAKDNHEVTTWYRNAVGALDSINPGSIFQSSSPSRTDRSYEPDSYDGGTGTGGGSTGTTVDSTDL